MLIGLYSQGRLLNPPFNSIDLLYLSFQDIPLILGTRSGCRLELLMAQKACRVRLSIYYVVMVCVGSTVAFVSLIPGLVAPDAVLAFDFCLTPRPSYPHPSFAS